MCTKVAVKQKHLEFYLQNFSVQINKVPVCEKWPFIVFSALQYVFYHIQNQYSEHDTNSRIHTI